MPYDACDDVYGIFFPKEIFAVSEGLNEVIYSVPLILSVFISSVMPAVCEEALHRGFILKSFKINGRINGFYHC